MQIDHSLEAQRRAKNPLQQSTRVGRWFFSLKDLARRTWRYGYRRSDPDNSPVFVTDDDLVRLAALVSIVGDTNDSTAQAFTTLLRDLFFIPGRCRQVEAAMARIPADEESLRKLFAVYQAYNDALVNARLARPFAQTRFTPKEIIKVMVSIENPEPYLRWVASVANGWKGKLTPARVFSALYDRYLESPAGLEEARAGTADPETEESIRRMFE